ncbi:MAG: Rieske 2Fe-2S domain-containing protein [Rhodospirillaceae bacterium]|nr:Rieske 2Fe-2S domain-containing protein [Rhodospirillaceae bacterium]
MLEFGEKAPNDLVIVVAYPDDDSGPIPLDVAFRENGPTKESFIRSMTKTYHSSFPPYPRRPPYWLPALAKAHRNARITPEGTCPHQGADLSDVRPDEQGIITCPLHGLRWQAETGAAAGMDSLQTHENSP